MPDGGSRLDAAVAEAKPSQSDLVADKLRASLRERLTGVAQPVRLGPYVVGSRLGQGGMGVVYEARDERLSRRVAVKLLQAGQREATAVLRREARLLAQMSHQNIVRIFDFGVDAASGRTWIAMELVEGRNLRLWLGERPRTTAEILHVLVAAGRGLAAMHGVGLSHGDFKPENVLVGPGVVKVADFGLARLVAEASTPREAPTPSGNESGNASTRRGGTYGFMPPERLDGSPADPRGDQFAFAAALFEALHGWSPYADEHAMRAGAMRPERQDVDGHVRRAIRRALHPRAASRYASMADLLDALGRRPARGPWLGLAAGGSALALAVLAWPADAPARCGVESSPLATLDARALDGLDTALAAAAKDWEPHATVRPRLDAYVDAWSEQWRDACGHEASQTDDGARACLTRQAQQVTTLVDTLTQHPDPSRAVQAVASLAEPGDCSNVDGHALPDDLAELDARATAQHTAAQYDEAIATAQRLIEEGRMRNIASARAAGGIVVGQSLRGRGDSADAAEPLEAALWDAYGVRDDPRVVRAGLLLVVLQAQDLADVPAARRSLDAAAAALERSGTRPRDSMQYLQAEATVLHHEGDPRGAYEAARRALERARADGADQATLASAFDSAAQLAMISGRPEDARPPAEATVAIYRELYGPSHPRVARALWVLASALDEEGRHDRAETLLHEARDICTKVDPAHSLLRSIWSDLGRLARRAGRYQEAREFIENAAEVAAATLPDDHPGHADLERAFGLVAYQQADWPTAARHLENAIRIRERLVGPDHITLWSDLGNLALVHSELRDYEKALEANRRARALVAAHFGPGHRHGSAPAYGMGRALAGLHRFEEAERALLDALELGAKPGAPVHLGDVQLVLAQVQLRLGRDYDEAMSHAAAALKSFDTGELRFGTSLVLARDFIEAAEAADDKTTVPLFGL